LRGAHPHLSHSYAHFIRKCARGAVSRCNHNNLNFSEIRNLFVNKIAIPLKPTVRIWDIYADKV
ncbi:MAG: hypothetical protein JSV31_06715, partial [Desulfobacterales bacterium]